MSKEQLQGCECKWWKQLNQLKKENELYKQSHKTEQDRRRTFEQTLEEIREIAKNAKKDICNNCGWRNTDSCDPTDYTCGEFLKIIEKINEVIDDKSKN